MSRISREFRRSLSAQVLLFLAAAGGCAGGPYRYGQFADQGHAAKVRVEHGGPHKTLDRISNVVSWPRRALFPELPDRRQVQSETIEQVVEYLEKNDLQEVYVSVRDYQPREQWRRLHESRVVPPLTRYSLGSLSVLGYTLFPGPVFGRNSYNPYTNTLHINSESPALLVHEAAYAKNIRQRKLPGAYVVASGIPFLNAWREIDAARDVVGYAQSEQDWDLEQATYREVYPKVGAESLVGAGVFVPFWWGVPLVSMAGGVVGSAAGKASLSRRESELQDVHFEVVQREVTGRKPESQVQQAAFAEPEPTARSSRFVTPSKHQE